jgi:hypothetical protein
MSKSRDASPRYSVELPVHLLPTERSDGNRVADNDPDSHNGKLGRKVNE